MKKIISTFLLLPTLLFAQSKEPNQINRYESYCMSVTDLGELLKNFEEIPFLRGSSYRELEKTPTINPLVVFFNAKNKTWTIVERTPEKLYCVLAVGRDLEPVPQEIIDEVQKSWQKSKS